MQPSVLVIMSTYNGEKFLREQIHSILEQKNVNLTLVIRDDGSEDRTRNIINEYEKKDIRVKAIYGENLGFRKSFFNTLRDYASTEFEYFAFADQDDVWLPQKLDVAIRKLNELNCKKKLYVSSLNVVDRNLNPMYINSFDGLKISYGSALSRQRLAGCTMVFDNALAMLCKKYDMDEFQKDLISHDGALYYICLACGGKVVFDKNSYIKFRRHSETVTEHGRGFIKRFLSITDIFGKNKNLRLEQAKSIYKVYKNEMTEDTKILSKEIISYKKNLITRIKLAFDKRIKCNIKLIDAFYAVAIIVGCY